jgi:hypothetical protein
MAIVLTDDEFVALDESQGLQNTGVPSGSEDNNDNDIVYTDLPAAFATRLFGAGQLNLSSAFVQANGAAQNDFISLTDGSTLTGFVKSDGDPLLAYDAGTTDPTTGVLAGFTTVDGEAIYLFADEASGLGASMFLGVDANGDIVLAGYLEADGTISTVQFEAITNPDSGDHDDPVDLSGLLDVAASGTIEFDFDDLPSGNNLFATLGAAPTGPAIVIFGADVQLKADGSTTNTGDVMFFSQAGPNATIGMNNQMFNPGDAAFFAYVNDVNADYLSGWSPNGLTSTEADDADNVLYTGGTLDVTAARFTIAQIQGNGTGSMKLTTYLGAADTARDLLTGPTDGATSPNIIMVKVTIGGVTTTFDSDADPAVSGFDVSGLGTATVTLTGVDDGYAIEFITDGDHNRVKIEATAGKFDIGGFVITQGITIHEPVGDRIVFEDDGPVVGDGDGTPSLTVDDSDFATNDSASYASLFDVDFNTDGGKDSNNDGTVDADAVTYALGISGDGDDSGLVDTLSGEAVLLHLDGDDVVGTTALGGDEVFRISVDVNTGEVALDQSRAVVHDDPDDPEEAGSPATLGSADLITLTATATDDDGDTAEHTVDIGDTFNFEDDGPEMGLSDEAPPDLITDDTDITDSDTADFSGLFSPDFGNDGAGDATTYALGVSGADADSGLVDTLSGEAVVLNLVGGEVVGTTAVGGDEVLRISVDADGNVTLEQSRAVVHDDPDDHDESGSPAKFSAAGLVTLTATAYDGDGDHDDATADIGLAFNFEDDGPSMELSSAEPPSLVTDDTDITDSDTADYSGLFDADFGNDGEASVDGITYALGVSGADIDSGLVDTLSGEAVLLNLVAGEVVGTTALGGDEVLRVSVDADGNVTLEQSRAVMHDDPDDPDESSSPASFSAADMVTLTATAYDGDGDHDDATANIGLTFNFEDDGPTMDLSGAEVPSLVTDDTDITDSDSADFSGLFTPTFGNDGAGADTTYALDVSGADADSGLTDTLSGEAVVLNLVGGEVVGTTAIGGDEVLRISVDADGNVTLEQSRAVMHDDPDDHDESSSPAMFSAADLVTLTATAYDGDGDHDDATADIGLAFKFEDDGPAMDLSGAEVPSLITDDTDITDSDSADFSGLFTPTFGNDGAGADTTYALDVSGADADSGLIDTLSGEAVVLNLVGGEVVGTTAIGGDEVLRISVDADGNVTLEQSRAVMHDDPDDHDESSSPAMFSAASLVTLTATAYDGDGDHADATAGIGLAFRFEDDGPSMELSDTPPPVLVTDDTDITDSDSADFSGVFDPSFGNDGAGADTTYALDVSAPDADSGLVDTLSGEAVLLNLVAGEVVGTTALGGDEVLRISVDAAGNVTLEQSRAVVHDDPDDSEESSSPATFSAASLVTLTATAYDGDGDHDDATANIGLSFTFEDDGPSIERNQVEVPDLTVDESAFGSVFADFSSLFDTAFGNDGPKDTDDDDIADTDAITYALTISNAGDDTGLVDSLSGEAVVLGVDGLDVIGVTEIGGLEVFRVSADGETGVVTLTQSRAVKHDDPTDPDESSSPATFTSANLVSLVATAYDGDGDHDSATLDISAAFNFEDDGPAIGPISDGVVDFVSGDSVSNLLGAVPGADGANAKITDFTESFDFGFGTVIGVQEGDQTVTYYLDENGDGSIGAGEDTAFFRLSLDTSDADPANWSYLFETLEDPAPTSIEFDFDNLPSGANLFGVVGESPSDPGIIVFGKNPVLKADGTYNTKTSDTINTSQGGSGATIGVNNQMFDPKEGAYFVYVNDPVANYLSGIPGGLSQTEADDADNVQYTGGSVDVHTASVTISQTQASPKVPVSMKITTWLGNDDTGRDLVLHPATGVQPNIVTVRVILPNGTTYEFDADADPAINGVDVSGIGTKSVTVVGLKNGYTVEWDTDGLHNRALIEDVAGKFDIGKFSIGETGTTPDGELDFQVTIEDFDFAGDTAVADFTIGIDGDLDGSVVV